MAITKSDVIEDAYSQMRISGLTVKASPEEISRALIRLESMMAEMQGTNLNLNYQFEEVPDPSTDTGVGFEHFQMMSSNLAMRMVDFGKPVPPELARQASQSMSNSNSIVAASQVNEVQYPNRMARGSGNVVKWNRWFRYYDPDQTPPTDSNIIVRGDTQDYTEFYTAYLTDGDTISSFTITPDNGLTLISSSNDDTAVSYRLNADETADTAAFRQVKIIIETDNGRQLTRLIDFNIRDNETTGSQGV